METRLYRIVDWENLYENNRTRNMKNMLWVPVPVKHDGYGYCQLVQELGAAGLGAPAGDVPGSVCGHGVVKKILKINEKKA